MQRMLRILVWKGVFEDPGKCWDTNLRGYESEKAEMQCFSLCNPGLQPGINQPKIASLPAAVKWENQCPNHGGPCPKAEVESCHCSECV